MNNTQKSCTGPELVPDSLTGVRAFSVTPDGQLLSTGVNFAWKRKEIVAGCQSTSRRSPPVTLAYVTVVLEFDNGTYMTSASSGMSTINCTLVHDAPNTQTLTLTMHNASITFHHSADDSLAVKLHPQPVVAALPPESHPSPSSDCTCGIYAYHSSSGVFNDFDTAPSVVAVIEATGKTLVGTKGFRASHAKILGLCFTDVHQEIRKLARARYDVPEYPTVEQLISECHTKQWQNELDG